VVSLNPNQKIIAKNGTWIATKEVAAICSGKLFKI
jgi:hypothetical protein